VTVLGICNFDTKRLEEIIDNGINVATNQVQVSYRAEKELKIRKWQMSERAKRRAGGGELILVII
jgi:diketogulonate reductase-like aldo/keto reductase